MAAMQLDLLVPTELINKQQKTILTIGKKNLFIPIELFQLTGLCGEHEKNFIWQKLFCSWKMFLHFLLDRLKG